MTDKFALVVVNVPGPVHAYEYAPPAVIVPVNPAQIVVDANVTTGFDLTITFVVAIPVHPPTPVTVTV